MKTECALEQDLLDAIASRRWPDRAEASLREHVANCAACRDVAVVATAFLEDRDVAADGQVPPASVVWWRSQIRAREEAARLALRPIALVQAIAVLSIAVALFVWMPAASTWARESIAAMGSAGWLSLPKNVDLSWVTAAAASVSGPLLVLAVWLVVTPFVVIYLAGHD